MGFGVPSHLSTRINSRLMWSGPQKTWWDDFGRFEVGRDLVHSLGLLRGVLGSSHSRETKRMTSHPCLPWKIPLSTVNSSYHAHAVLFQWRWLPKGYWPSIHWVRQLDICSVLYDGTIKTRDIHVSHIVWREDFIPNCYRKARRCTVNQRVHVKICHLPKRTQVLSTNAGELRLVPK